MATYLADTNLLLRLADPASPQHSIATQALAGLLARSDEVYLTPQNFIEFWAVATRPVEANGFGWSSERTSKEVGKKGKEKNKSKKKGKRKRRTEQRRPGGLICT